MKIVSNFCRSTNSCLRPSTIVHSSSKHCVV